MAPVPSILARGDTAVELPRLGGMARPDGVVIASERYWAFAGVDGSLREGEMPQPPELLARIPLLRGLIRLVAALTPLFRGAGVAGRRERYALLVALVAPFGFVFLPERIGIVAGLALAAGLLGWLLRGRTRALHGAEHRAIAALEERRLVAAWSGDARPTRFARRCGTNFAALVLPVALVAERAWPLPAASIVTPLLVTLLSLAVTMELWRAVQSSERFFARALLLPGLGLQRLTTAEPSPEETRVALAAASSVLRRELNLS